MRLAIVGAKVMAVAAILAACSSTTSSEGSTDCTDTAAVARVILVPKCATPGCHSPPDNAGALDFTAAGFAERLVGESAAECGGQTLVVQGNADASYLFHKVADEKPPCGARMPFGKAPLSSADIACVRTWVTSLKARATDGGAGGDGSAAMCGSGMTACGAACVDTTTDGAHCGKCDNKCAVACSNSTCVTACPSPTTNCAGSCVHTATTAAHCGGCGKTCDPGKVCVASACACGQSPSFKATVEPILTGACGGNGCHGGVRPQAGLLLTTGKVYASLVNVPSSTCTNRIRVKPGAVDQSYLVNKLTGVGMCAGTMMPKTGNPLPAADLDRISAWICNGAQSN